MANLEFCDKHNMVTYLKKPNGVKDSKRYFGRLPLSHTVDNGEQEITATFDGKDLTITEASVRRHLQLVDAE
ncbi:hypothetical protein Tco_1117569, partial [Tanacetum coccineum]